MNSITQKIDGYWRQVLYEWHHWHNSVTARKREKNFNLWLRELSDNPPDVFIGGLGAWGGVRHHLLAIKKYSALQVELVPNESLLQKISANHLEHDFNNQLLELALRKVKAVHSNVYPWFIEWYHECQSKGILWIHTYHNHYYPEFGKDGILEAWQVAFNKAFLQVAPSADVKLSVSKWQREELLREHGIATEYLPNGVDVVACDEAKAERFIRKIGIKDFVLYVGRNDPVKNPVEFVMLAKQLPEHQFVMVGGGLSSDSLRNEWQVDIPSNLLVVGALSHWEALDAIAACSVLVVTSKREGLPTLVMEGMAHRKAVVVPNEAGCLEVVNHGEFGHVYQLGYVADLADKTLQALADTELGERARQRIRSEYDWRVIAPKLDAIYQGTSFAPLS